MKLFYSQIKRNFGNSIGIVGSGQMGTGIAYVFARIANKKVYVYDANKTQLEKSNKFMLGLVDKEITKGTMRNEDKQDVIDNFSFIEKMDSFKECNFVIEAVTESLDVKQKVFQSLDEITSKDTILASNTSSISITKIASFTKRPNKVIGMHFMNPVPVMKLVEIIKGLQTDDATFNTTIDLVRSVQKEYAVSKDIPGFIANRILMPYLNEAIFTLYEGIGSIEDIDKTMKLGTNVPMGPLTLADFIGLDTVLYILQVLYNDIKDPKYRPCPLLVNYVNAGWLGRKSGQGFYDYTKK